jgi:spermidine/putrescine transport system permease protein
VNEYDNPWLHRLKWTYLLLVVLTLMIPVLYVMYVFTLEWYGLILSDEILIGALRWTLTLAVVTTLIAVPMALLAAKYYKTADKKLFVVFLLLAPLFVPPDILGSALLVSFKNLNAVFIGLGDVLGTRMFDNWFRLSFMTAAIGLVIYTIPYSFVVILITMGRYRNEQTEAARACGANGWRAFWDIEFPQIRAGVFSACAFTVILVFNEYTRTSLLKGGFDTFTTVLISQMLNTGMSPQSYAMSALISFVAIAVIGSIILITLIRAETLARIARGKPEPVTS